MLLIRTGKPRKQFVHRSEVIPEEVIVQSAVTPEVINMEMDDQTTVSTLATTITPTPVELTVNDFVIAVSGKRWYVAQVLDVMDNDISLTFMTPKCSKWKWGQRDEGVVDIECILFKGTSPKKVNNSVLLDIQQNERQKANELFALYQG